uniref:Uncharacterized protein n=1 Tax=Grammatophora oceanica TaxID=210454 RepID=A0A7S1Y5E1_9STRA|mmetsp:Transcript_22961/g.34059  ORF Transcript_22961/g.34059 Transcript_22961/m.34059 type:complete len:153 (+) Transcript_22961:217-675(+)
MIDYARLTCRQAALPSMNVFGSMILHGPKSAPVLTEANRISRHLASQATSVRPHENTVLGDNDEEEDLSQMLSKQFGGGIVCRVSRTSSIVRIASDTPEDQCRVAHACIRPLQQELGIPLYRDRIQTSRSMFLHLFILQCSFCSRSYNNRYG